MRYIVTSRLTRKAGPRRQGEPVEILESGRFGLASPPRSAHIGPGEGNEMMSLLVAVRDFLVALALAWVGVSLEARTVEQANCASDVELCATQRGE